VGVVEDFGRPHAPLAAQGFEFAQGTTEGSGVGARGEEEVELVGAPGDALALEGDVFDGGMGGVFGQGQGGHTQQDPKVEGGSGEPDAARIPAASLESQAQVQGFAGQSAQGEAFAESRDQPAQDEPQGFQVIDGRFQIHGFFEPVGGGFGQGGGGALALGAGDQGQRTGPQSLGQAASGESKKIAHGVHTQPGESLGEAVVGVEEVEG
jgi:hypothetical protein